MPVGPKPPPFVCHRCLRNGRTDSKTSFRRLFSQKPALPQEPGPSPQSERQDSSNAPENASQPPGRLSEKLEQMTEEALEQGGRGAQKSFRAAGFSEDLKAKLEARLLDSKFRSQNPSAFAQAEMPVCETLDARKAFTDDHRRVPAEEPARLPPPSLGQDKKHSEMQHCACLTMLISQFGSRAREYRSLELPPSMSIFA